MSILMNFFSKKSKKEKFILNYQKKNEKHIFLCAQSQNGQSLNELLSFLHLVNTR